MFNPSANTGSHATCERQDRPALGDVAGLVHDINNPLFAILGHVEFALREAEPGSPTEERMLIIQRTGLEIKEILRSLAEQAREKRTATD
jgi:signal transduction histidine kinase